MTLKEATETAKAKMPVMYNGSEYLRIVRAGYWYDDNGLQKPFVTILDKCGHSLISCSPHDIEVKGYESKNTDNSDTVTTKSGR